MTQVYLAISDHWPSIRIDPTIGQKNCAARDLKYPPATFKYNCPGTVLALFYLKFNNIPIVVMAHCGHFLCHVFLKFDYE